MTKIFVLIKNYPSGLFVSTGTPSFCVWSMADRALWLGLQSFQFWASCHMNKGCPFQRWLPLVRPPYKYYWQNHDNYPKPKFRKRELEQTKQRFPLIKFCCAFEKHFQNSLCHSFGKLLHFLYFPNHLNTAALPNSKKKEKKNYRLNLLQMEIDLTTTGNGEWQLLKQGL